MSVRWPRFVLGVAPTSTLLKHIVDLEAKAKASFEAEPASSQGPPLHGVSRRRRELACFHLGERPIAAAADFRRSQHKTTDAT